MIDIKEKFWNQFGEVKSKYRDLNEKYQIS